MLMVYPSPHETGGHLIREVIAFLRAHSILLPLPGPIYIAVSGGADSVALAHLLAHYGRRIVTRNQIVLLHINHGWRGKASDQDARFVQALAKQWKIKIITRKLKPHLQKGISWENEARKARKKIYKELALKHAKKNEVWVLTAHHSDDLAETMVWRMMTGDLSTHGGGILVKHSHELRPLLRVRKETLKKYLKEERVRWREDKTNFEGRFLRSRMRVKLMPVLEDIFPKAIKNLVNLALSNQR